MNRVKSANIINGNSNYRIIVPYEINQSIADWLGTKAQRDKGGKLK